jgi:hypothetical protein
MPCPTFVTSHQRSRSKRPSWAWPTAGGLEEAWRMGTPQLARSPWQRELPSEGLKAERAAVAAGLPEERLSLPKLQVAVGSVSGGETAWARSAEW